MRIHSYNTTTKSVYKYTYTYMHAALSTCHFWREKPQPHRWPGNAWIRRFRHAAWWSLRLHTYMPENGMCVCAYVYVCICMYVYACVCLCMRSCYACSHGYIYKIHTHTHTHTSGHSTHDCCAHVCGKNWHTFAHTCAQIRSCRQITSSRFAKAATSCAKSKSLNAARRCCHAMSLLSCNVISVMQCHLGWRTFASNIIKADMPAWTQRQN